MTQPPGPHLSPDDIDLWLDGTLDPERRRHLDSCPACLERAQAEREITEQLSALPLMSPGPGFADRVMQSVVVPDPFAIRSLATTRRRLFATPRAIAVAASLIVLLLGSMTASVIWTLGHREVLVGFGSWLLQQAGQAGWIAVRGLVSNFIEQPWYSAVREALGNPARLAIATASASLTYVAGVLALRRLMAVPTQQVANVGA